MPSPGDVDIVLAAELMEAGRAIQRGLVTPDRTTLITSTHRTLAVIEVLRSRTAASSRQASSALLRPQRCCRFRVKRLKRRSRREVAALRQA
jgi:indolepyruvate ferredoxin oxidoreductase beta subunit